MINAMVKDIAGKSAVDASLSETGKVQKSIICEALEGTGTHKHCPDWRPRWMQVPPSHYIDKSTYPLAQADAQVSKVMMAGAKAHATEAA